MKNAFHFLIASTSLLALLIGIQPTVHGETISQIPDPFTTADFFGQPAGDSQFDAITAPGDLSNFATIYDNFLFTSNVLVTNFSWIGRYQFTPDSNITVDNPNPGDTQPAIFADSFTVSIFSDLANEPGALLTSFNARSAGETQEMGDFYRYSFDLPTPFAIFGNTQYWFSVVANLNADTTDPLNVWGVAFSNIGDGLSYQDFQLANGDPLTRFADPIDYAFSVTAIPEPGTVLVLAAVTGVAGLRRYRRSHSENSISDSPLLV